MRRRYNLSKSDNFPISAVAIVQDTVVLEDSNLSFRFLPNFPSLVTRINLEFSRGNFLSDIEVNTYVAGATPHPVTLFSETNYSDKIAGILSPQTPLYLLDGDYIDVFAKIAESTRSSSSSSSSILKTSLSSISSTGKSSSSSSISSFSSSSLSSESSESSSLSSVSSNAIAPESDFTWVAVGGEYVRITGYTGPGGVVHIPDTIDGLPVTIIGRASFSGTSVVRVFFPDGIEKLSDEVFKDCSQLISVSLPSTLTDIGAQAFQNSGLKEIVIPDNVVYFGLGDMIDNGSIFADCTSLVSVTIGSGITDLYAKNFENCSSLESILFTGDAPTFEEDTFLNSNENLLIYYYSYTSGWGVTYAGFNAICVDCSSSTEMSSSLSSTGRFSVTYTIHYIPLYQLSNSETLITYSLI